jgi:hypothetical protein
MSGVLDKARTAAKWLLVARLPPLQELWAVWRGRETASMSRALRCAPMNRCVTRAAGRDGICQPHPAGQRRELPAACGTAPAPEQESGACRSSRKMAQGAKATHATSCTLCQTLAPPRHPYLQVFNWPGLATCGSATWHRLQFHDARSNPRTNCNGNRCSNKGVNRHDRGEAQGCATCSHLNHMSQSTHRPRPLALPQRIHSNGASHT